MGRLQMMNERNEKSQTLYLESLPSKPSPGLFWYWSAETVSPHSHLKDNNRNNNNNNDDNNNNNNN